MPTASRRKTSPLSTFPLTKGWALRNAIREGYKLPEFKRDVFAGITVAIVALPLVMAFAIASGVAPQYGLYTAIIAGGVIPMFGGSRVVVSGPTASFVAVLAPIAAVYGLGGLLLASFMAGFFLFLLGMFRMGKLIQFIPYPVTTGFTAGISVVIMTLQIKDFFGLPITETPRYFHEKVALLLRFADQIRWEDTVIAVLTVAILIVWPRVTRKVPAPLVATATTAIIATFLMANFPTFHVETIGTRYSFESQGVTYHGIAPVLPAVHLPWNFLGANGKPLVLSFELLRALIGPALTIAMLGAIVSLLCAVVADGMTGLKHDPDAELMGLGIGNMVGAFFGGIPASGAIARTSANVRSGGRSPVSAIVHAAVVLIAMLTLAPLLSKLPTASLAALLVFVAFNMLDLKHIAHMVQVAPRGDLAVLISCFSLTVLLDMVVAVSVGVVLAALLFMNRMAEMTQTRLLDETLDPLIGPVPPNVIVYEIAGPLFFGAAEKFVNSLQSYVFREKYKAVILHMAGVPHIDTTGLVALESMIIKLKLAKIFVILSGVQPQPREVFAKAEIVNEPGKLALCFDLEQAFMLAEVAAPERLSVAGVTLPQ